MLSIHQTFVSAVEELQLPVSEFNHLGHLRLAYFYICRDGIDAAVIQTCNTIKRFAEHNGANKKFHQTITEGLVRIMAQRISAGGTVTWEAFLKNNHDLVEDANQVLLRYYSPELLCSDKSRTEFLQPDLESIEK